MNSIVETLYDALLQVGVTLVIAAMLAGGRLYLRSASEYVLYRSLAMHEWLYNETGVTVVMPSRRVWQHRGGDMIHIDRRNARTLSLGEESRDCPDMSGLKWYAPVVVTVPGRTPTWHYAPVSKERFTRWEWHRRVLWFSMIYKRASFEEVVEYRKGLPLALEYDFDLSSMAVDKDLDSRED